jgi:hypothetical protein
MGSILKFLFGTILLLLIGAVILLGYFGLFPALSNIMGTNKPRDLGMHYSEVNFNSALNKSEVEIEKLAAEDPRLIAYEGSHKVNTSFTDEELTAHAYNKDWVGYPVSDMQVRINDDDTAEVSGMLELTKIGPFLEAMDISQADFEKALTKANIPLKDVPFYAKGYGSASNNTLDIHMTNFEVGRFPVPKNILDQYQDELTDFGYSIMDNVPGFSVSEARFENGAIYFDGQLPDVELTKR